MLARLFKLLCLYLLFSLLFVSLSTAEEKITPITPENATQLVKTSVVGSALPRKLSFSPDNRYFLASTTEQTYIFQADAPALAPHILPFNDFTFDDTGRLVGDEQYWNLDTGLSIGIAPTIRVLPPEGNRINNVIEVVKPGGETLQVDIGFPYQVVADTAVSDDYSILVVMMEGMDPYSALISPYLYHLPTGQLYATLPQGKYTKLFFIKESTTLVFVSDAKYPDNYWDSDISVYAADTGTRLTDYSGEAGYIGPIPPDRSTFSYSLNTNETIVVRKDLTARFPYTFTTPGWPFAPYAVGQQYIAIREEEAIIITDLDDASVILKLEVDASLNPTTTFYFTPDDRHLVYITAPVSYIWDLTKPELAPVEIPIDARHQGYPERFSPDFMRYPTELGNNMDGKKVVWDAATNEMLAELPLDTILNDAVSLAIYWQEGTVILRDLIGGESTVLPVIKNYLGKVLAFNEVSSTAAFVNQQLTLVRVPDATIRPVELPYTSYRVDFTADGETFLVSGNLPDPTDFSNHVTILDTRSGEVITEIAGDPMYIHGVSRISPAGHYVVDPGYYGCGYDYSESLFLFPAESNDAATPLIEIFDPCGAETFAFTKDDATFYVGGQSDLLAFKPGSLTEPERFGSGGPDSILSYYNLPSPDSTYGPVRGIVLSPDEQRIVLFIWTGDFEDSATGVRAEIFNLDDLSSGTLREDVQPLSMISDVTGATFSPDSQYLATNKGLFKVGSNTGAEAVNGEISAFTSDSQVVATYQDGYVDLWNTTDFSSTTFPLAQYAIAGVHQLAFSPDNRYLYVVREGDVQVWVVK